MLLSEIKTAKLLIYFAPVMMLKVLLSSRFHGHLLMSFSTNMSLKTFGFELLKIAPNSSIKSKFMQIISNVSLSFFCPGK